MGTVYTPDVDPAVTSSTDPRVIDGHVRLMNVLRGKDARLREKRAAWASIGPVVYFVRRGAYIKIGYSTNFQFRMYHLQVQPRDILALVAGSPKLERRVHGMFIDALVEGEGLGTEHFRPVPELLDYIDVIRDKAGVPALVRRT